MARTKQELATAVMRRLAAIDQNSGPSSTEMTQIGQLYDDKYAELVALDLVYWPNTGNAVAEIPNAAFQALARIIGEEVAPNIGEAVPQEQDEDGAVLSIGNKGLRMLRRQMAQRSSGVPTIIYAY